MREILPLIQDYITANKCCVLVTIVEIIGSSPRELGTSMLVTREAVEGSIGGGNLEYRATSKAHELLSDAATTSWHEEFFGLGPTLNQCCGGAVKLVFEILSKDSISWITSALSALDSGRECTLVTDLIRQRRELFNARSGLNATAEIGESLNSSDSNTFRIASADNCYLIQRLVDERSDLYLFGAGHVGKAVVQAMNPLPFRIHWIDQRSEIFPESITDNVQMHCIDDPLSLIEKIPTDSFCLVMTHSHKLDYEICKSVLNKLEPIWLGLIGSVTKRRRFEQRLLKEGIPQYRLDKLICPIGISGISDKNPVAIAASVAAQLLQQRDQRLTHQHANTTAVSA